MSRKEELVILIREQRTKVALAAGQVQHDSDAPGDEVALNKLIKETKELSSYIKKYKKVE